MQDPVEWVERAVVHASGDAQYDLHQDTFHQIVKLWVYPAGIEHHHGPLHVVRGSHRCTPGKLRWLFSRTRTVEAQLMAEPSLRLSGLPEPASSSEESLGGEECEDLYQNEADLGFGPAVPVLPLAGVRRTLVVADTSGLHRRGAAEPGVERAALRPKGLKNDGGVLRQNPFADDASWRALPVNII